MGSVNQNINLINREITPSFGVPVTIIYTTKHQRGCNE